MFRHRSFWIILLITAFVWLMATMSEHSDYSFSVPLRWDGYDTSRYVVNYADTALPVTINANYFQALSFQYTTEQKPFTLHVSTDTVLKVNSLLLDNLVKQYQSSGIKSVTSPTESLRLSLTERESRAYLPVLRDVNFQFTTQHGLYGSPLIEPDTVWLYGDPAMLNKIPELTTAPALLTDINDSGWFSLALNPVWKQFRDVHSSTDSIRVFLPVERYVEKTVTVNVVPVSHDNSVHLRILPERVNITFWVPAKDYDFFTADQVEAVVVYTPGETGSDLPVRITRFPDNMRVKQISPATLQYVIIKNK